MPPCPETCRNLQTILSLALSCISPPFSFTYIHIYIYTFIPLSRLFPFSFSFPSFLPSGGGGWKRNCLQFMTTCRASSYGRDTGSEGGYFYTVVPPTKINADSWIISVSGFLENFRALMCALLSGDKCCLQAYWRGKCTVNGEGGNFSVHDENL